jgi:type IV pilus biogenesis protein CpaD/CtpE
MSRLEFRLHHAAFLLAVAVAAALLAGCDTDKMDPYKRPGMWQPEGVNAANLSVMVADPADLVRGRSDDQPNMKTGAAAVNALWQGKITTGQSGSQGGASSGGGMSAPAGGSAPSPSQ